MPLTYHHEVDEAGREVWRGPGPGEVVGAGPQRARAVLALGELRARRLVHVGDHLAHVVDAGVKEGGASFGENRCLETGLSALRVHLRHLKVGHERWPMSIFV